MLRQLSNEGQNALNTLKLYTTATGCCGDTITQCKYVANVPTANTVSAIVVKDRAGVNKTLTFPAAVTTVKAIKDAIVVEANEEGYEDDGKILPGVDVRTVSTNKRITLVGELELVSVTHSGGSASATKTCTKVGKCSFEAEWGGGASKVLTVDGVNATLGDLTFATASAANVKSALEGAANWPSGAVATVVKNAETSLFEISIANVISDTSIILDGIRFAVQADCVTDYV